MKKLYYVLGTLLLSSGGLFVKAQSCSPPSPPLVSGNTLIACSSGGSFSLSATTNVTNSINWYNSSTGSTVVSTNSMFVTPPLGPGTTTYYVGATSGMGTQTLTMPSHNNPYSGNVRGYWFTAPTSFTITGVFVPTDVGSGNASAAVLRFGNTSPPAYPSVSNTFTTAFLAQNSPGTSVMAVNIPVQMGEVIGVLGSRAGSTSYGNGSPLVTLGNYTVGLERMGMQYPLATTAPMDIWTEIGGSVGRVFLYVTMPCQSTLTPVTVSVNPNAQISVSGPSNRICAGTAVSLSAQGLTSYTWSNGPQVASQTVTPSSTTTYSVIGTSGSCGTVAAITVSVDAGLPSITAGASSSAVCQGNSVALVGTGATSYTWSNNVGNNVPFFPNATATYTLSSANSCGTSTATTSIVVNPNPPVTAAGSTMICEDESATLTASGAVSYTWNPGNLTGASVVVSPTVPTGYSVTGTDNLGCRTTVQIPVIVKPAPVINLVATKTVVCVNGSSTITATGTSASYLWNTSQTSPQIIVVLPSTTAYSVQGTHSNGCTRTATIEVAVFEPTLAISGNTAVCQGSAITLTVGGGTNIMWSTNVPFSSISVTPNVSTTYSVTAEVTHSNQALKCPTSNSVLVTVHPLPSVTATPDRPTICKGEQVTITASGPGVTGFLWQTGATTHTLSMTGLVNLPLGYTVTGTDQNGCQKKVSGSVIVSNCLGVSEQGMASFKLYPNPNNGAFRLDGISTAAITVFDNSGRLVRCLELNENNGYSADVQQLPAGIYLVRCVTQEAVSTFRVIVE
jgi:hypothetical protein